MHSLCRFTIGDEQLLLPRMGKLDLAISPGVGDGGLDFFLEAGDEFAVGGDEGLLGFDLGDDGLLGGEGRKWNGIFLEEPIMKSFEL